MATARTNFFCASCQTMRLGEKEGINHVLHLLLSIVTCGVWLIVWLLLALANSMSPFRCTQCGQAKTIFSGGKLAIFAIILLLIYAAWHTAP
jgi:hypothetical protein